MDKQELINSGIDYEEGVRRFCGAEDLYCKFLKKFLEDTTFDALRQAMQEEDYEAAFQAAHTLKGLSGNLSLTPLYEASKEIVEMLREGANISGANAYLPVVEQRFCEMAGVLKQL